VNGGEGYVRCIGETERQRQRCQDTSPLLHGARVRPCIETMSHGSPWDPHSARSQRKHDVKDDVD
jgi:hypothetical protein